MSPNSKYLIQFKTSGFSKWVGRPAIKANSRSIKDPYSPSNRHPGYYGECSSTVSYRVRAYNTWRNMMVRCYVKDHHINPNWEYYGGNGVFVDLRWHNFSMFLADIQHIPGFSGWLNNNYELDKDYYASNCYSKSTCVFISPTMNKRLFCLDSNRKNSTECFEGTSPSGSVVKFLFIRDFLKNHKNMNAECIRLCCNNEQKLHNKWTFRHIKSSAGKVFRPEIFVDQLQNVIDKLRTNPNDRRLIVSAWNPAVLPDDNASFSENVANGKQALPPCHYSFQFLFANNKLNLIFNMRSVDVPLGLPFNIASYALLLEMVAMITDLSVGELVWSGADVHIYENQINGVKEQLTRSPLKLPRLVLNQSIKEIDDFTANDIQLIEYNHHPAISMPIAV